jgi:thiamine-phosphate pyrophosphorylase
MRAGFDPRLYLVTDPDLTAGRPLEVLVAEAVRGGVTLVQLRDKAASGGALFGTARLLADVLRPLGVPLIVNDRVDVAHAAGADGVHVGQSDLPAAAARAMLGPDAIVGISIERLDEIETVDPAVVDYVAASPVFATATKTDVAPPLGVAGVAELRRRTGLRLVGIGGITADNAAAVCAAGADGVAVVSAILGRPDPGEAAADLRARIDPALALRRTAA